MFNLDGNVAFKRRCAFAAGKMQNQNEKIRCANCLVYAICSCDDNVI